MPVAKTVYDSDLSLLDGMPLLWVARLIGTGLREKSSGSDLFQELWRRSGPSEERLRVYLFGGMEGVAECACRKIGAAPGGIECAGFLDPGFGSIDALSRPEILSEINRSGADSLVIALGARKGQLWIDRNRGHLKIPIVSHLGAVLNFVAGNVKRAPVWMQKAGLEWVWRILEEPALWRRYLRDGLRFGLLFFRLVLPYALWRKLHPGLLCEGQSVTVDIRASDGELVVALKGACLHDTIAPLREKFAELAVRQQDVVVDLGGVAVVDGAFLGLCLVLKKHVDKAGRTLRFQGLGPGLTRIFRWNCLDYLL